MLVTNNTYLRELDKNKQRVLRKFKVIAAHEHWRWVIAVNGDFTHEGPLTFNASDLEEIS